MPALTIRGRECLVETDATAAAEIRAVTELVKLPRLVVGPRLTIVGCAIQKPISYAYCMCVYNVRGSYDTLDTGSVLSRKSGLDSGGPIADIIITLFVVSTGPSRTDTYAGPRPSLPGVPHTHHLTRSLLKCSVRVLLTTKSLNSMSIMKRNVAVLSRSQWNCTFRLSNHIFAYSHYFYIRWEMVASCSNVPM